jgi:hypothetical protein
MAGNPGFLGMRGTGDWATNQRPENWRETILYLYPNGTALLTGILSKLSDEKTDDPVFHWWTKALPSQAADLASSGLYTDSSCANAYTSGGAAGDVLYAKVSASGATHFRIGHQVLLRDQSDYEVDKNAIIISRAALDSSYYALGVKLLEADSTTTQSHDLSDADRILVISNANSEGANMPDAISYDPTEWSNYTQIFRTPLSITRTARRTRLRTGDAYREAKRECLELHSIEMEKAFLWGYKSSTIGDNGKPRRTTMGLIRALQYGSDGTSNVGVSDDFKLNSTYSGDTWLQSGKDWLDYYLEQIFRYGRPEKLCFCGSGAMLGLNQLAETYGTIQLQVKQKAYGIMVTEWVTPFGIINLKTHPLFSYEASNRHSMVIFEPQDMRFRFIDDTTFFSEKSDQQNTGWTRRDGTDEEYLTEAGLEYHHPNGWGYLNGVGEANTV